MNSFPLIKTRWSNEHIMAAVFLVLVLYHLPRFIDNPTEVFHLILLTGFGLLIDCFAVLLHHKRLWCCVSGAVTAAMLSLFTFGVPVWGQLLGVASALIIGKHLWGGTGKNLLNPAMVGLLAVIVFYETPFSSFVPSLLLLPAVVLSLFFLTSRPFAGIGFLLGSVLSLAIYHDLSLESIISSGIIFWSCLVMTDPVTVTPNPVTGSAAGFLAGFAAFYFQVPAAAVISILAVNIVSYAADILIQSKPQRKARMRLGKVFISSGNEQQLIDLTGDKESEADKEFETAQTEIRQLQRDKILTRIRDHGVFGMGGAAFPAYRKIMTVLNAEVSDKYLIVNGAECDPGLIHDDWLLQKHFNEIKQGIELLKNCLPFTSVHLAVKKKPMPEMGQQIVLNQLPDRYPVGAERILIEKVLGKKIPIGRIPASEGILVLNVQTVYAISQAVLKNRPVSTRFLTVADLNNKTAQVVKVRLGMKIREVCEAVYPGAINVFAGGGCMQAHLADENETVDKNVNFIAAGSLPVYKESPQCSKCGRCAGNCPNGLKVNRIADLVDQNKLFETERLHAADCIGCGSCSYSCPAGRNLAAKVARAKEILKRRVS